MEIAAVSGENSRKAIQWIESLTREVEIGALYLGKVTRMMSFGAFVEILPGKEGLVRIGELADYHVPTVEDVVSVGDEVMVVVTEIDRQGRVNLSPQGGDAAPPGEVAAAPGKRNRGKGPAATPGASVRAVSWGVSRPSGISTDPAEIDVDWRTPRCPSAPTGRWARTRETVARAIANSICVSAFDVDEQVGFARVVTDHGDVRLGARRVRRRDRRGQGIGTALLSAVTGDARLARVKRMVLATDAKPFYAPSGVRGARSATALDAPPGADGQPLTPGVEVTARA